MCKHKKILIFQMMGEQLEWDLYYKTQQANQHYYPYTRQCKFKLVAKINGLSALSYTVDWPALMNGKTSTGPYLLNAWNQVELPHQELRFPIKIKLGASAAPKNGQTVKRLYNADSADVEVHCEENLVIKAHKTILAAHSKTLHRVLANTSCNFGEGKREVIKITEEHIKPAILTDVIKWMYLHNIEDAAEKVGDLLAAADHLQIAGLKETCGQLLIADLNQKNCLEMLNTAYKYNIKNLKQRCNEVFVANKKEILETTQDLKTLIANVPDLVVELLGLDKEDIAPGTPMEDV
jgi:hypothetical protein